MSKNTNTKAAALPSFEPSLESMSLFEKLKYLNAKTTDIRQKGLDLEEKLCMVLLNNREVIPGFSDVQEGETPVEEEILTLYHRLNTIESIFDFFLEYLRS